MMHRNLSFFVRICAVFLLCVLLLNPSMDGQNQNREPSDGVFRMRPISPIENMGLDPVSGKTFILAAEQIFDGLVKLGKNLNVIPALAEYWAISPDGKTYTFFLRKGVRFHHGPELTSSDVKISFERILDSDTNSPYADYFLGRVEGALEFHRGISDEVTGFRVVDDYIFQILWERPCVSALYLLSLNFCSVLPKDLLEERRNRFFNTPSGTGPYKFDSWIRTPEMVLGGVRLERNEEYFKGTPYIRHLEFSPFYTLDHFLFGEIDSIPVISDEVLKPEYQIVEDGILNLVYLGISCQIPPFNKIEVRQAVYKSLDRKKIVLEAYDIRDAYRMSNTFIPPHLPGFFPSDNIHTIDISQAKALIESSGVVQEEDQMQVMLFMPLPRERRKIRLFREISNQLQVLGLRFRLRYYSTIEEVRNTEKPSLVVFEKKMILPDPDDIIRPFFHSSSLKNVFGFSDPKFDSLVLKAEVERSWTKRIKLYHEMEKRLFEGLPAVPLFVYSKRIAIQPYVKQVVVPPLGIDYLEAEKIWLDK